MIRSGVVRLKLLDRDEQNACLAFGARMSKLRLAASRAVWRVASPSSLVVFKGIELTIVRKVR